MAVRLADWWSTVGRARMFVVRFCIGARLDIVMSLAGPGDRIVIATAREEGEMVLIGKGRRGVARSKSFVSSSSESSYEDDESESTSSVSVSNSSKDRPFDGVWKISEFSSGLGDGCSSSDW